MKGLRLLIILFIPVITYSQESQDVITIETIKEISILEFSSVQTCERILEDNNKNKLRDILYLAILTSVSNIINHATIITADPFSPYKYKYVYINNLLEYDICEKDLFKYIHDPMHPYAVREGKMKGYVKYPDIDVLTEEHNINKIINILLIIK